MAARAALATPQQLLDQEARTDRDHVIDTIDRAVGWMNTGRRVSDANRRVATNKFPADRGVQFLCADDCLAAGAEARRR